MPAKSAQAFADSVGVNVHASYTDTVYGDWNRVVTELKSLGIRHVRDGLYANPTWGAWNTEHWNKINQLPANGIKANLILGHPRYNGGSIDNLVAAVRDRVRGAVESVEGPNEWDLNGGSTWVQDLRAYQTALYQKVRATPELNGVPVLAPSFGWMHTPAQAGDLKAFTDRRNMHPYTGGRAPSQDHLAGELSRAAAVAGDDPAIATEAGFHTAMSATNGQPPTSEAATGAYVPRTFLEHFKAGIERTFLYELVDLRNDTSRTDAEAAFGLYRNNWTPKPGASSLRNLMGLVRDSARVDNPGALDVTMTGDTAGVQHLLLKHSDGSYALVLWQSESVWDHTNRRDLAVPTQRVNLAVAEKFGKVETFRPTAGAAAVKTQTSSASIAVDVPGDPVVIKLSAPETGTNEPVTGIVSDPNPTPGLRAEFFSGIGLTGTSTSRVEPGVNYFWGQGSPAGLPVDSYSVRWSGKLTPRVTEDTTFIVTSDDGSRLWVNGQLVTNDWSNHASRESRGVVRLTAGQPVDIKMEYFENGGDARAKLEWQGASTPREVIPTSVLSPPSTTAPTAPAPTTPTTPTEPAPTAPTAPTTPTEPAPTAPTAPTTPSEPAPTTPTGPTTGVTDTPAPSGLRAEFFAGDDLVQPLAQRTDQTVNFNWGGAAPMAGVPADNYSVRWSGRITPRVTEDVTFITTRDDGMRLWVDGRRVLDAWTVTNPREDRAVVRLTAGQPVNIRLEYFERSGGATAKLEWQSPSFARQVIPASVLSTKTVGGGLRASFFRGTTLSTPAFGRIDSQVGFDWGTGAPDYRLGVDGFSARWTGKLTPRHTEDHKLWVAADDGVRLYVDGQLVINDWSLHYARERSVTLPLTAGKDVDIKIEYYEQGGSASMKFGWESAREAKGIVPASQLTPTVG